MIQEITGSEAVTTTNVQCTSTNSPPAGPWRLSPGHALTVRSARAGLVRVVRGGVWATFDGPHAGPGNDRGDYVLEAGEMIMLRPGERLVLEPAGTAQEAQLEWRPVADPAGAVTAEARVVGSDASTARFGRAIRAVAARLAQFGAGHGRAPA